MQHVELRRFQPRRCNFKLCGVDVRCAGMSRRAASCVNRQCLSGRQHEEYCSSIWPATGALRCPMAWPTVLAKLLAGA